MPKRRAASRWLSPSTWQAWRTLPYSSTENIPRLPARSDRAQGRHQGGTVWHRRGRDTQPAVSEGHFLTAAYTQQHALGQAGRADLARARGLARGRGALVDHDVVGGVLPVEVLLERQGDPHGRSPPPPAASPAAPRGR